MVLDSSSLCSDLMGSPGKATESALAPGLACAEAHSKSFEAWIGFRSACRCSQVEVPLGSHLEVDRERDFNIFHHISTQFRPRLDQVETHSRTLVDVFGLQKREGFRPPSENQKARHMIFRTRHALTDTHPYYRIPNMNKASRLNGACICPHSASILDRPNACQIARRL